MNTEALARRLGTVTLEPAGAVVAGSVGQWTITLTVGSVGIDEGGTIKIAQRFASDWEPSQFDKPTASGYTTVRTSGEAKLRPHYEKKGQDRPWMQCIVIDVYDGSLAPGDTVTVVLGDKSQGSPGIRSQTFIESAHEFRVFVDPTNACVTRPVANSPKFPIISGPPVELVCIVPTQAVVGERVGVFVKGQDKWGNPTPQPVNVKLSWQGSGDVSIDADGSVKFNSPGSGFVVAESGSHKCTSNPIAAYATDQPMKRFWGDLHAQSDATVGTGTEEEYFAFARDIARLDFCSHQANDFQVRDEDWKKLNDVVRAFHKDHEFVAFPGWEWSGNSTVGGDRNVWFLEEGMPIFRSSHWQVPNVPETDQTPADTAADLFDRMRILPRDKVLLGSHVGGRFADIRLYFDQELGPLVELVSCWGVFEWMLWDAFDKGYIVGVMCNSDGHKGRPGAEGPGAGQFGIANGLTCVLAESKTRVAIFRALKERRCYGTTGARIDLDFQIDGQVMGSIIRAGKSAKVVASVKGTAPIESLELFEGKEVRTTVRPMAFTNLSSTNQLRVSWRGSRIRGRGRRVNWDGAIRVEGARIVRAKSNFDTPVDRITKQTENEITFISQTTGDTDSIDLVLDQGRRGVVHFESKVGSFSVDLSKMGGYSDEKHVVTFGGLGIEASLERYPEHATETSLDLNTVVQPPAGKTTPYFVKVSQCNGQMAWSSPIYLKA